MLLHNDGSVTASKVEELDTWKSYINELLNRRVQEEPESLVFQTAEVNMPPVSMEETTRAIKKLKNNKAAGCDNILADSLKHGGDDLEIQIHSLVQQS